MFERTLLRTGLRFGLLAASISFLVLLLVYFSGKNPYGQNAFYSLFLLPIFLFLGTAYYKKHFEPELKFFKGLKLAWLISLVTAVTFSGFVYVFAQLTGSESIPKHVQEMKAMMEQNKAQFLKLPNGKQVYELNYSQLNQVSANTLVLDNFLKLLLIGFLFSLVSATFYRK